MKFSFRKIQDQLFLIEKEYTTAKEGQGSDVSGPYWMLIKVELREGSLWWWADGQKVHALKQHYLFVPPFSWTKEHLTAGTRVKVKAIVSRAPLNASTITGPVAFTSEKAFPKTHSQVESFLRGLKDLQPVSVCSRPSALAARTKVLLDQGYASSIEIGDIAQKLKTSAALVSRNFKREFGHPPAFYRKGLKVTVGMFELMMGASPLEAAEKAGYQDLGRFYKQFKAYLKQTPAEYGEKSKNAKKKKFR